MTAEFFPRKTVAWKLEEPAPLRQLSLSLPYMALVTGVLLRLWRSYVLTHGAPDSWAWVGGTFLIGMVFLFLMVTIHLGNFTLRHWIWRAPVFAILEAGVEILMSLALTTFGLEPLGADRAELSDWLPEGVRTLIMAARRHRAVRARAGDRRVDHSETVARRRTADIVGAHIHRASLEQEAMIDGPGRKESAHEEGEKAVWSSLATGC